MKKLIPLLLLLTFLPLLAVDKMQFDLREPGLGKALVIQSLASYQKEQAENAVLQTTMVWGGYYTIGTVNGISSSALDDHCEITFGHPYAMTSHPLLAVNGIWQKPEDFFAVSQIKMQTGDNTLKMSAANDQLNFTFSLRNDGASVEAELFLQNASNQKQQFGAGLVFDPALGRWGDGHVVHDAGYLGEEVILNSEKIPNSLELHERDKSASGIKLGIDFPGLKPDKIIAANWPNLYNSHSPEFTLQEPALLYDLCLKMFFQEIELQPGEHQSFRVVFSLLPPDFGSTLFSRWDLPRFLSMETNQLFPRDFSSFLETNANANSNAAMQLTSEGYLYLTLVGNASMNFTSNRMHYIQIDAQAKEIYEDRVTRVGVQFMANNQIVDEIWRTVFVPAVPLADTGLTVIVDSLDMSHFPNNEVIFAAEKEASGQRILDLAGENIFLFENAQRIKDFQMEKYSGGGSSQADVVFVLDCSGSMGDNIAQVRDNLNEFGASLVSAGYDYRIGVVTFSTTVDDVWDLTNDLEAIRRNLASIQLWGGVEDSPSALYRASQLSFRPGSKRTIIWVTDEPYPTENYTKEQVVNRMLQMGITVHGVGLTELQTDWFNPIVLPTGGKFFDIMGNFRDILLEVATLESEDMYRLAYRSSAHSGLNELKLEIHYAGLGGNAVIQFTPPGYNLAKRLICYPNPFNPETRIEIKNPAGWKGQVDIYNILGQRVKQFPVHQNNPLPITWNAHDEAGLPVGTGFYLVQLLLTDPSGQIHRENEKILYLK